MGLIPGGEDPLEEGKATHSSILGWRILWAEEPGGLQSMGLQRVRRDWETKTILSKPASCSVKIFHKKSLLGRWKEKRKCKIPWPNICAFQQLIFCCSITKSSLTLCNPMDRPPWPSTSPRISPSSVHWIGDAIQPSHPLSACSLSAFNLFQNQHLFHWVGCSHQVAKYWSFNNSVPISSSFHSFIVNNLMVLILGNKPEVCPTQNCQIKKKKFIK